MVKIHKKKAKYLRYFKYGYMKNSAVRKINVEPLYTFFTEDTNPKAFAKLLDEFLLEHLRMLVMVQLSDEKDKTIHEHTDEFILYIRTLRDILLYCENQKENI